MTLAQSYKPKFRNDVFVNNPDNTRAQINERYCLTNESAEELVAVLHEQGIEAEVIQAGPQASPNAAREDAKRVAAQQLDPTTDGPTGGFGGGFSHSDTVAFLQLKDGPDGGPGTVLNAGLLANYYANNPYREGSLQNVGLNKVLKDIEEAKQAQGFAT